MPEFKRELCDEVTHVTRTVTFGWSNRLHCYLKFVFVNGNLNGYRKNRGKWSHLLYHHNVTTDYYKDWVKFFKPIKGGK